MFARTILPVLVIFGTLLIVLTLIYGIYNIYENKKQIDQNWPQYKCKPYVFPFAGWLVGPSNTNPMNNFRECSWLIFQSFFDVLIAPFVSIITMIVTILTNFNQDIQNMRKMVNYIRSSIRSLALDIYQKIWDAYYRIAYIYKAFMKVFLNIFNIMQSSFDVLMYSYYSLSSLWNGPIGKSARFFGGVGQDVKEAGQDIGKFFCFDERTKIKMSNGKFKSIKKIDLGDELWDGGKVMSTYIFIQNHPEEMYVVVSDVDEDEVTDKPTIVSGSHLILENGQWIRVKNSSRAKPYYLVKNKHYSKKYIHSLRTSNSLIITSSGTFRDYDEINSQEINKNILINQILNLNYPSHRNINNFKAFYPYCEQSIESLSQQNTNYRPYFDGSCKIDMMGGSMKFMKDIAIDDKIFGGGRVIGIIRGCRENTLVYTYNLNGVEKGSVNDSKNESKNGSKNGVLKGDIICTQGAVVNNTKNHCWTHVYHDEHVTQVKNYDKNIMYSLLTEKGIISINNIIFKDHDVSTSFDPIVEKYIEDILNQSTNN